MSHAGNVQTGPAREWAGERRTAAVLAVLFALTLAVCAVLTVTFATGRPTAQAQSGEPPAAPTGLSNQARHDRVVLTWDNPGNAGITHHQILRRDRATQDVGGFTVINADTGSPDTEYTDTTVEAGGSYVYRVKAVNRHGASPQSSYSRADTPAAPEPAPTPTPEPGGEEKDPDDGGRSNQGPPSRPQPPTLSAGDSRITVSWTAPDDNGSPITEYRVQWKTAGQPFSADRQATDTASPHVITGLDNGAAYQVRVIAVNDVGASPPSPHAQATPAGPPNPPSQATIAPGDRQLTVAWEVPAHTGSDVTGYTVQWKNLWQDWSTSREAETTHDQRILTIKNLVNDWEHYVRIRSRNALGESPWSADFQGIPREPPKALPTGLGFAGIDSDAFTATVTFDPNGHDQTMYLRYSKVRVHPLEYTTASADAAGESHAVFNVTGLASNTKYYVEASPYPGFEYGDGKVRGYVTTTATAPDVTGFRVEDRSQDAMTLRWQSIRGTREYEVRYKKDTVTAWTRFNGDFDHLPSTSDYRILRARITGLECGTGYHFTIRTRGDSVRFGTHWSNHKWHWAVRTTGCPQPERITDLSVEARPVCATLSWTAPTGTRHEKYRIVRSTDGQETVLSDNWYATFHEDCSAGYRDGQQHRYTVEALDGSNNRFGGMSTERFGYGPQREPGPPGNIRLTADNQQQRRIEWDGADAPWLTGYVIQRRAYEQRTPFPHDPEMPNYHLLGSGWTTLQSARDENTGSFHVDRDDAGTDLYAYRVRACNQRQCSVQDVYDNFDWAFMEP